MLLLILWMIGIWILWLKAHKELKRRDGIQVSARYRAVLDLAAALKYEGEKHPDLEPKSVVIRWQEPHDSEFAKKWPEKFVFHDRAPRGRHSTAGETPEMVKLKYDTLGLEMPVEEPKMDRRNNRHLRKLTKVEPAGVTTEAPTEARV